MTTPNRYSRSQILCGLDSLLADCIGHVEPFDAETEIYAHMKDDRVWDEIDVQDLFFAIEQCFAFRCPMDQWKALFQFDLAKKDFKHWETDIAPKLTFGYLADFIAHHASSPVSFDPVFVLGRHCAPAGAFTGIRQLALEHVSHDQRFAPSTPIIEVLHGRDLDAFWKRLRWMTMNATPELPRFWQNVDVESGCLAALAIPISAVLAWEFENPLLVVFAILIAIFIYQLGVLYKQSVNPLPSNLLTFRDLSLMVSNHLNIQQFGSSQSKTVSRDRVEFSNPYHPPRCD